MSQSKRAQGLWKKRKKKEGLSISLHTNGNIISQCLWYLVVEQKEPLWKQLPRDPPSGGRDTACQDFQRGAAENAMRQEWFISVSHFPEISWFRYYFNLTAPPPQHCVSLLMIPVWACLILERCVHTNELVHRICFAWECEHRVGKKRHKKHAPWGCITPFMIRLCASLNGFQLTVADRETGVQAYCGRKSDMLKPLANQP